MDQCCHGNCEQGRRCPRFEPANNVSDAWIGLIFILAPWAFIVPILWWAFS